jgi:hypothetical protein
LQDSVRFLDCVALRATPLGMRAKAGLQPE